jgi:hypothetical protein
VLKLRFQDDLNQYEITAAWRSQRFPDHAPGAPAARCGSGRGKPARV